MNSVSFREFSSSTELSDDSIERLLLERFSCRAFLPDPVPEPTIRHMLRLAQRTPSSCNTQPWQVAITTGSGTDRFREALVKHVRGGADNQPDLPFPQSYAGPYRARRLECALQLYESVGVQRGDREASAAQALENFRLFGAPHVAIVTTHEALGPYGVLDCGAYVNNFMLVAQSVGVATIPQAALALQSPFIRNYFDLDDSRQVVCAVSFGYQDAAHPVNGFRTHREAIDDVAAWFAD